MAGTLTKINNAGLLKGQRIKAKRDLKDLVFVYLSIGTCFFIASLLFFYLWCRVTVVNLGYEVSTLNKINIELKEQNKRHSLELSRLKSPERLERVGRNNLKLEYPGKGKVILIK